MAGVGIGTVSRAMNDSPLIKPETKNHVLEVIKALNYRPHAVAQSLARKRTNSIAVIVPHFTNYFFVELLRVIQKFLINYNYDLILYTVEDIRRGSIILDRVIKERRVDGVLYLSLPLENDLLEALKKSSLPIVMVDNYHKNLDSIVIDNIEGGFIATEHLILLGHRRVGLINGTLQSLPGRERYEGYRMALNRYNLDFDESRIVICDRSIGEDGFNEEAGYGAMKSLLALQSLPTAMFISSDVQAIGAMRAIREAGLSVPEDIGIVGFDDIHFAEFLGLTTIHQPLQSVGGMAVERLMARLHGTDNGVWEQRLKTRLVVRRTCGAAMGKQSVRQKTRT